MILQTGFLWVLMAVGLYGLVHSLLASLRAKNLARRWLGRPGERYYRLFYVLFVSIALLPVLALIVLLPDEKIYTIPFPWVLLTIGVQGLAVLGIYLSLKDISVGHFLGVAQVSGEAALDEPGKFVVSGAFRYTRHPLYLFSMIIIWLFPIMTWNVLAFNLGATIYMMVGTIPEERKLLIQFGKDYAEYRQRTPWLIPRLDMFNQEKPQQNAD